MHRDNLRVVLINAFSHEVLCEGERSYPFSLLLREAASLQAGIKGEALAKPLTQVAARTNPRPNPRP